MPPKRLNTVLRALREKKGWSQRELAAKAETTGAYVAMLETGAKKNPSLDVLKRLAKALGVSVVDLLK
jgi:transcriptional regulator with XRE-family HTH domain